MQGEIDLWVWSFDKDTFRPSAAREVLSPDENARATRFVFERDAMRFISRRLRVREILGEYLSCDPADIAFDTGAYGKPFLNPAHNSNLHFNLSHSEDLAVLAVARGLELGVDVEGLRPVPDGVADRFFYRAERAALAQLPPEWAVRGFFECWTGKEAFVKARGGGLSIPLDNFEIAIGPGVPSAILRIEGDASEDAKDWRLWRFEPAPGFLATLAARTGAQSWLPKVRTSG